MLRHLRYCSWLLACALLLGGCSALQLTYNQADTLLGWRAHSYFDLDAEQRHEFNLRINRLLAWHRREQLPDYARFTHTAVERARGGLRQEDIQWFIEGLRTRYQAIVDRGITDAAELLTTLDADQLRAVSKEFTKDNRKFVDENELEGGAERQRRARLKRVLNQITDWTGSLNRQQEQRIEAMLATAPLLDAMRYQDRLRRQREFQELLALRAQRPEFQKKLHAWLLDWERGRSPEYERAVADATARRIEFYLAVDKLLTPAQRERALKRLHGFGDDFKALGERGTATAAAAMLVFAADTIAMQ
jgi:hypothetical protein